MDNYGIEDTKSRMTQDQVWETMTKRGWSKIIVEFSGGGDSGGAESIMAYNEAGEKVADLEEGYNGIQWDIEKEEWVQSATPFTEDELFANAVAKPVYDEYGSFAGEFYVDGTVVWSLKHRGFRMKGTQTIEMSSDFGEDWDEEED